MTDTETRPRTDEPTDGQPTTDARSLGDISHTNPNTGRSFGGTFTYARGRAVAADGGERGAADAEDGEEEMEPDTLEDVQHTPPNESDDANRVFERGEEDGAPVEDE